MTSARSTGRPELARGVLMIRPAQFARNSETLATNRFQVRDGDTGIARDAARREFDALAAGLEHHGIGVRIFEGDAAVSLPDEVFSNNWLSTHPDGTVVTYPLQAPSRRRERRADIVDWLKHDSGFKVTRVVDLSPLEDDCDYLEGTGSAVIDYRHGVAYCGQSARTSPRAVAALAAALGMEFEMFATADRDGFPVYHTNVLLAIGATFAVACIEAIAPTDRERVVAALAATDREVLAITLAQMHEFAANLLALQSAGGPVIAMSTRAWNAYGVRQKRTLERHGTVVTADIATIETLGGGSVRCMLTELLLPSAG